MIGVASPLIQQPSAAPPSQVAPPTVPSPPPTAPGTQPAGLGQTLVMQSPYASPVAPLGHGGAGQPGSAGMKAAAKTMLGMAPIVPPGAGSELTPPPVPSQVAPQAPPASSLPHSPNLPWVDRPPESALPKGAPAHARTMIGMAPPSVQSPAQPQPPAASPQPQPTPFAGNAKKTLVGMGSPFATPGAPAAPQPSKGKGQTLIGMPSPLAQGNAGPGGLRKTLLGMAFPGLAPAQPLEPELVEEEYEEVVPETGQVQKRVRKVAKPPPPLYRRPGFWVLVTAPVLLVGGVAAALLLRAGPPLAVDARADASGKDVLHVTCKTCPDGTKLAGPAGAAAIVQNGEADMTLAEPLKVGQNALSIAIDRPEGRDETVKLDVPVSYRIWADINALQDAQPAIRVEIEAVEGTTVNVQGKPVPLTPKGRTSHRVDVQQQLVALPRESKAFESEIPYTIAPPGGAPHQGKLSVRVGVTPLAIDSPPSSLITDQPTFLLAGSTSKGGGLQVAGAAITVGGDGTFRQHMKISAPGSTEIEVRASTNGAAPRLARLKIKLVTNLQAEGKELEGQRREGYGDVTGKGDEAASTLVAWRGEVLSTSTQQNQTIAIVEVSSGCSKKPCRARVVAPPGPALSTGDKVGVYGRVTGMVSAGDAKLPNIEAELLLKNP